MDRRKFIANTASFLSLPILLNGQAISVWGESGVFSAEQTNGKILILIQLDGGNDGLSTLIPLDIFDKLANVRPHVILPQNKILSLTDLQGLHPSMTEIKNLYEEEKMMFIQNTGYPQPNLSHFRSKEIVLSASDSKTVVSSGWFGRYLEMLHPQFPENYPGESHPHPLAITIGNNSSPTCQGDLNTMGMVLKDLNSNYTSQSGASSFPDTPFGYELEFISRVMKSTEKYLELISETAELSQTISTLWPENNSLADKLKIVARLISGGLSTPVYVVNLGGFDTHAKQVEEDDTTQGQHAELLKNVSQAVAAFQDELKQHQREDDVISLVYSEFGRRIASNTSFGTDHGEAYPMMLLGSQVNPLIYGENPEIPEEVEKKSNVPMKIDFRSVYASLLHYWFKIEANEIRQILFEDFELIPILKSSVSAQKPNDFTGIEILSVYPNPIADRAKIEFYSPGGNFLLKLYTISGRELNSRDLGYFPKGKQQLTFDKNGVSKGQYLLVLQNRNSSVSKKIFVQ